MTDWDAQGYHDQSALQAWLAEKHLAFVALNGDERVLDVGCGDGKVTASIAARLPEGSILGVDASVEMIEFARAHELHAARSNLAFEVGDAAALPYQGEFDLIVSFNALHWVRDQHAALGGIRNSLKESGRALLLFVGRGSRPAAEDVTEAVARSGEWERYFDGQSMPFVHPTADEYAASARRAGLQAERVELEELHWDFGDHAAFGLWIGATFSKWIQRVPAEARAAFVDAILTEYRRRAGNSEADHVLWFYQLASVLVRG